MFLNFDKRIRSYWHYLAEISDTEATRVMLNNQTTVIEAARAIAVCRDSLSYNPDISKKWAEKRQRLGQISCISLASRNRSGHNKDTCRGAFDVGCNTLLHTSLLCETCMLKANESTSTTNNKAGGGEIGTETSNRFWTSDWTNSIYNHRTSWDCQHHSCQNSIWQRGYCFLNRSDEDLQWRFWLFSAFPYFQVVAAVFALDPS